MPRAASAAAGGPRETRGPRCWRGGGGGLRVAAGVVAVIVAGVITAVVVARDRRRGAHLRHRRRLCLGAAGGAALTGRVSRDGGDAVRAELAGDHAANLERAAGGAGLCGEPGDLLAVAAQGARPGNAVPVLVDLELDLDAAVFTGELQRARRLLGAETLNADDAVVAAVRGGGLGCDQRDGEQGEDDRDARAEHFGSPLFVVAGSVAISRSERQ